VLLSTHNYTTYREFCKFFRLKTAYFQRFKAFSFSTFIERYFALEVDKQKSLMKHWQICIP